ncbi:MAG: hypothetical protein ABR922_06670 [Streptosporangiaceae bacterium]|jgi:hypothetical protein
MTRAAERASGWTGNRAGSPYWLSLLADLSTRDSRTGAARATLDAALATGRVHDDVW